MTTYNNENFLVHLPVFDGKNYDQWIMKMKVIFRYIDVLDVINDSVPSLARNATEVQQIANIDAKKKDEKAIFIIRQCVNVIFLEDHVL